MITIRREQTEVLERHRRESAIADLLAGFSRHFPVDFEALEPNQRRAMVEHALRRAEEHGLTEVGDCWRYLTLTIALGAGFDSDLQLPWAEQALRERSLLPQERMHRLFDAAGSYMAAVSGPNGRRYVRALLRVQRLTISDLSGAVSVPAADGVDALLRRLHPEKHELLGAALVARVAHAAEHRAAVLGLGVPEGQLLVAGFMFLLGSRFDEDAAHRWVHDALAAEATPLVRCASLLKAARARIERMVGRRAGEE